jgi:hypothetical protein
MARLLLIILLSLDFLLFLGHVFLTFLSPTLFILIIHTSRSTKTYKLATPSACGLANQLKLNIQLHGGHLGLRSQRDSMGKVQEPLHVQ